MVPGMVRCNQMLAKLVTSKDGSILISSGLPLPAIDCLGQEWCQHSAAWGHSTPVPVHRSYHFRCSGCNQVDICLAIGHAEIGSGELVERQ